MRLLRPVTSCPLWLAAIHLLAIQALGYQKLQGLKVFEVLTMGRYRVASMVQTLQVGQVDWRCYDGSAGAGDKSWNAR